MVIGGNCKPQGFARPMGPQAAIDVLNVRSNTSCGVPSFPRPTYAHASAVTPIGIVACGGETEIGHLTSCYRLSTENKWVAFPSLKHTRAYFSMKYMDGILWAIGGEKAKNSMEYIDLSNLDDNQWTVEDIQGAEAPSNIYGPCITEYPGKRFLLIGGNENTVNLSCTEMKLTPLFQHFCSCVFNISFSISVSQLCNKNLDFRPQNHNLDSREKFDPKTIPFRLLFSQR